ncbi:MAG: hypothetical protein AAGB31_12315 [Bdellovibrio sp.]
MATKKAVIGTQKSEAQANGVEVRKVKYHSLITETLLSRAAIKKGIDEIDVVMKEQSKLDITLGRNLFLLREGFEAYFKENKTSGSSKVNRSKAFYSFIETRFGLQERRVQEYIRVAKNPKLASLNIGISSLVEIARLPEKELTEFLKVFSSKTLSGMTFKEVQSLVRKHQPESKKGNVKSSATSKEVVEPQTPAVLEQASAQVVKIAERKEKTPEEKADMAIAQLTIAFQELKADLPEAQAVSDMGWVMLDSLLSEINQWVSQRKLAQKKVA